MNYDEQRLAEFTEERFGPEVKGEDVPGLVAAGREVWSCMYGAESGDFEADEFTTISDLDTQGWDEDAIAAWGPFRGQPLYAAEALDMIEAYMSTLDDYDKGRRPDLTLAMSVLSKVVNFGG